MKFWQLLLVIALSVGATLATVSYSGAGKPATAAPHETGYQRVMRTGELRCGYSMYAPYFTKDSVTGAFGGIWHDFTEALGTHLGLRIVWTEEVGYGDVPAAFNAGKIDAFCSGLWTAGKRVAVIDFLKPTAFEPLLIYVRKDDHRFDQAVDGIDDPAIRISAIDGEGSGLTAAENFPKATIVSLPQLASVAEMFNQVVTKKADIVISAPIGAAAFLKNNPGTLRPLFDHPLKIFPDDLAVRYGDNELRDMLNQAQDDIINNGEMDKILNRYEDTPGEFWRMAKPYAPQGDKP